MIQCVCDLCKRPIRGTIQMTGYSYPCVCVDVDMDGDFTLISNSSGKWHVCKQCEKTLKKNHWMLGKKRLPNRDEDIPVLITSVTIDTKVEKLMKEETI